MNELGLRTLSFKVISF